MKNLKDAKPKIFPSKTRGGKELPSSSALDSPSIISKLATPPHAINPDISQVIGDATSAMNDTYDGASTLLDDDMPLGEFLDEQIARVRQHDIVESDDELETENLETPTRTSRVHTRFTQPGPVHRISLLLPFTCTTKRYCNIPQF